MSKKSKGKSPCNNCSCASCVRNMANCNAQNKMVGDCNGCGLCKHEGKALANLNCTGFKSPASQIDG